MANTSTSRAVQNDDSREYAISGHVPLPEALQEITLVVALPWRCDLLSLSHEVNLGDVEIQMDLNGIAVEFDGVTGALVTSSGITIDLEFGTARTNPVDTDSSTAGDFTGEVGNKIVLRIKTVDTLATNYQFQLNLRTRRDDSP